MPDSIIPRKWAIVCATCVINFMIMGPPRLSGMFFLALKDSFGATRGQAALPFTLCYSFRNIFGPCYGFLAERYGLRRTIVIGCIISSAAVLCCFFADGVIMFTILWGGIYGVGAGLGTNLLPQVLNKYFTTRTAVVNGISIGGTCLGAIFLPILMDFFLKIYGLSGSMLLLSGIMMNSIPIAVLLWIPKNADETHSKFEQTGSTKASTESNRCSISIVKAISSAKAEHTQDCRTLDSMLSSSNFNVTYHRASDDNSQCVQSHLKICEACYLNKCFVNDCSKEGCTSRDSISQLSLQVATSDPSKEWNVSGGNIKETQNSKHHNKDIRKSPFLVFLDPTFIVITVTQSLKMYIGTFVFTICVDVGRDAGVEEYQEPYLLMSLAVSDTIGRFFLGFVADKGYVTYIHFAAICSALMGAFFLLTIFVSGFEVIIVMWSFHGLFFGGVTTVYPGISTHFVRKEHVTMAIASSYIFLGPMNFTQAPLIALFREHFGSYNGLLALLCALSLLCSLMTLLIPHLARQRDKTQEMDHFSSNKSILTND